jgi:hypothetical protein
LDFWNSFSGRKLHCLAAAAPLLVRKLNTRDAHRKLEEGKEGKWEDDDVAAVVVLPPGMHRCSIMQAAHTSGPMPLL